MCPKFTPWVSGILYVNNLAWQSTRVEVERSPGVTAPAGLGGALR